MIHKKKEIQNRKHCDYEINDTRRKEQRRTLGVIFLVIVVLVLVFGFVFVIVLDVFDNRSVIFLRKNRSRKRMRDRVEWKIETGNGGTRG